MFSFFLDLLSLCGQLHFNCLSAPVTLGGGWFSFLSSFIPTPAHQNSTADYPRSFLLILPLESPIKYSRWRDHHVFLFLMPGFVSLFSYSTCCAITMPSSIFSFSINPAAFFNIKMAFYHWAIFSDLSGPFRCCFLFEFFCLFILALTGLAFAM